MGWSRFRHCNCWRSERRLPGDPGCLPETRSLSARGCTGVQNRRVIHFGVGAGGGKRNVEQEGNYCLSEPGIERHCGALCRTRCHALTTLTMRPPPSHHRCDLKGDSVIINFIFQTLFSILFYNVLSPAVQCTVKLWITSMLVMQSMHGCYVKSDTDGISADSAL